MSTTVTIIFNILGLISGIIIAYVTGIKYQRYLRQQDIKKRRERNAAYRINKRLLKIIKINQH